MASMTVTIDIRKTDSFRKLIRIQKEVENVQRLVPTRHRQKALKHINIIDRFLRQLIEVKV